VTARGEKASLFERLLREHSGSNDPYLDMCCFSLVQAVDELERPVVKRARESMTAFEQRCYRRVRTAAWWVSTRAVVWLGHVNLDHIACLQALEWRDLSEAALMELPWEPEWRPRVDSWGEQIGLIHDAWRWFEETGTAVRRGVGRS